MRELILPNRRAPQITLKLEEKANCWLASLVWNLSLCPIHIPRENSKHRQVCSRKATTTGSWQGSEGFIQNRSRENLSVCGCALSWGTAGLPAFSQREAMSRWPLLYSLVPERNPVLGLPAAWKAPDNKSTEPGGMYFIGFLAAKRVERRLHSHLMNSVFHFKVLLPRPGYYFCGMLVLNSSWSVISCPKRECTLQGWTADWIHRFTQKASPRASVLFHLLSIPGGFVISVKNSRKGFFPYGKWWLVN